MANKEMTATEKMRQKFADKTMDVKQLENVAGGTTEQNDQDLEFLRKLLNDPLPNEYSKGYQLIGQARAAEKGWAKVGVTVNAEIINNNRYFIGPLEVSQKEAMDFAKKVVAQRNK